MAEPALCHVTWLASDLERTRAFLVDLFGWAFEAQDDGYLVFRPPSGAWVGLSAGFVAGPGRSFLPQVAVADLDELVARARTLGVDVDEVGEIPGVARYADLRDPDGAAFSVLQFTR